MEVIKPIPDLPPGLRELLFGEACQCGCGPCSSASTAVGIFRTNYADTVQPGAANRSRVAAGFFRVGNRLKKQRETNRNREIFNKNREGDKARTGNH